MEDNEIIDEIKKGRSMQDIKDLYIKRHVPSYRFYVRVYGEDRDSLQSMKQILDCVEETGFTLVEQKTNQKVNYPVFSNQMTSWLYENHGFSLQVHHIAPECKRKHTYYDITWIFPDGSRIHTGNPKRSLKEQLKELMELWPSLKLQLDELEYRVSKLRRRIDIGESTIDTIVKSILNGRDRIYNVTKKNRDTYLRIRMKHRRYIEIKLIPTMDVTKLVALTNMIETVTDAMDAVGNINLTVKNYGGDIQWATRQSITKKEET